MGRRITLTKSQAESPVGRQLIEMILSIVHDGRMTLDEVINLHRVVCQDKSGIPAFEYLRARTREIIADGVIDRFEEYRLKQAFERVVPKDVRSVVSTHLEEIELPFTEERDRAEPWRAHAATSKQIDYIIALGGRPLPDMNKGEASDLIEELLEGRPPTPRQQMLIRFFGWDVQPPPVTKERVSEFTDIQFAMKPELERAWDRFKLDTDHDPFCTDPLIVPIGAYRQYVTAPRAAPSQPNRVTPHPNGLGMQDPKRRSAWRAVWTWMCGG